MDPIYSCLTSIWKWPIIYPSGLPQDFCKNRALWRCWSPLHLSSQLPFDKGHVITPSGHLPRWQVIQDLWTPQEKWMEVCCLSVLLYWSWVLPWPVRQWLGMDVPVSWHPHCPVTGDDQIFLTSFSPWVQRCLSLDYGLGMGWGGNRFMSSLISHT